MTTLTINKLSKKYGTKKVVIKFSMDLSSGEIVGLLGPNGAGKTTAFYMIIGLVKANKGNIMLDNIDISKYKIHQRSAAGISYLPQEASIFRKLTVADNIMAILELRKDLDKKQRFKILENLLQEFKIEYLRKVKAYKLSGGERRRVEIARTLATNPKFILLDEPFAGVDPISVLDIKRLIIYLKQRGIAILITDHNVRDTLDICERAYIINEGVVICSGDTETIMNDKTVRDVYLGSDFKI